MSEKGLAALLAAYAFADGAIRQHGRSLTADDLARLHADRADAFDRLLFEDTDNAQIAIAQLRLMIEVLGNDKSKDPDLVRMLMSKCASRLDGLAAATAHKPAPIEPTSPSTIGGIVPARLDDETVNLLNSSTDRIVVLDREYRYVFSNLSNAAFHSQTPQWFVGKPLWHTTNTKFFADVNKPNIDKGFSGHRASYESAHPGRDPDIVYSCLMDPLRDARGEVSALLAIIRQLPTPCPNRLT